jgi:hypothetical protein
MKDIVVNTNHKFSKNASLEKSRSVVLQTHDVATVLTTLEYTTVLQAEAVLSQ